VLEGGAALLAATPRQTGLPPPAAADAAANLQSCELGLLQLRPTLLPLLLYPPPLPLWQVLRGCGTMQCLLHHSKGQILELLMLLATVPPGA
jgi:hypothetical protein